MLEMSATEARASLPALLDLVFRGEEVVITRHGRPVAVIVRPDTLRSRRGEQVFAAAAAIRDRLAAARRGTLEAPPLSAGRADALVAEIRAGRDGDDS